MFNMENEIVIQKEANEIFQKLKTSNSINDVAEIVENLSEEMAKAVLKKFVYNIPKVEGVDFCTPGSVYCEKCEDEKCQTRKDIQKLKQNGRKPFNAKL